MIIKFRAWGKYKKKMHLNENYNKTWEIIYKPPYIGLVAYEIGLKENEEADALVLMQFTGLTDVNGKEIYEDDIVKNKCGHIGKVVFKHGAFVFQWNDNTETYWSADPDSENDIEVIGNIWEHPNLLKGGKDGNQIKNR